MNNSVGAFVRNSQALVTWNLCQAKNHFPNIAVRNDRLLHYTQTLAVQMLLLDVQWITWELQ